MLGGECKSHIMERDAPQSDFDRADAHLIKMDSRSPESWEELHQAVEKRWGCKVGIHAPTRASWGDTVSWLRDKKFKLAQVMMFPPGEYFPKEHVMAELTGSLFRNIADNSGIEFVVHSPYVIQIAGQDKLRKVSAKSLKAQCVLAQTVGFKKVVVHASSPRVTSQYESDTIESVYNKWLEAIQACNKEAPNVKVLIENPAWRNTHFSDPAVLAEMIRNLRRAGAQVGMCYDSAHHWASMPNYDEVDLTKLGDVVEFIHLNDSPVKAHGGLDRHSYRKSVV